MIFRRVVAAFLVLALIVVPVQSSYATVATGALTDRGVFSLTAAGAAKLGLAEAQIAAAVRVLGLLGRVSTVVSVGFVAYEVASGLWDWWAAEYQPGSALTVAPPTMGTFGVQSGSDIGDCMKWMRQVGPGGSPVYTYDLTSSGCPSNLWTATVGQTYSTWVDSYGMVNQAIYLHGIFSALPSAASAHAVPGSLSGRADFVAALDSAAASLAATSQGDLDLIAATANEPHPYPGSALTQLQDILAAARAVVSGGVAVTTLDVTHNNVAASVGTMPGAIASPIEPTSTDGTAAITAALAAVSAAIAASQAAVVSAVQAVAAPIVAAIAASQAAVVSAVGSIVAPIVASITGVQTAVESVGAKVDSLAAQQAAQDAVVPSVPVAVQCVGCARFGADEWALLWGMIRTDGMAAPIFGLIARLVWPGGGSIDRTWSVGTWQGHAMTVDLEASGLATAITVVRFVVVGGAVIVAYMIIFG